MEENTIKIFESKLQRLRDMDFKEITDDKKEIDILLDYWKEIVVNGLRDKEKYMQDIIRDKEEKILQINNQLSALEIKVESLEHKNMELVNSIEVEKLRLDREKMILEDSYKDKYEGRLGKAQEDNFNLKIDLEKSRIENEHMQHTLQMKISELEARERELDSYRKETESSIRKKDEKIIHLEEDRENLEKTIDLISRSKMNSWIREERARMGKREQLIQEAQEAGIPDVQQVKEYDEKIKSLEREKKDLSEKMERKEQELEEKLAREKENIAREYEGKFDAEVAKRSAEAEETRRDDLLKALRKRENLFELSLSDLSRGFVHRMRNVVGIVSSALQIAQDEIVKIKENPKDFIKKLKEENFDLINELLENFGEIIKNVDGAIKNADSYLKLTHVPEVSMIPESLNAIVEEVRVGLEKQCKEASIKVETDLDEDIPEFAMDKKFLKEAFYHIMLNSVESMPQGGAISIETRLDKEAHEASVVISDTGEGIPDQRIGKVFQVFCTSKKDREGIGLPLANRFIQIHLGSIKLESTKDHGTTVTVRLPVINKDKEEEENGENSDS
ncbi:MAG: hypothetical protein JXJ19_01610 [Elusimicrobia bacterium]|nr:hypothetical protein [Elusimicrobiota bacterium]